MSMSTHVVGIRPPDARWQQMKTIYDSCEAAGIDVPDEVIDFFDDCEPDPSGVVVDLESTPAVEIYKNDMSEGFEVDLSALPAEVKIIRFYNSW